MYGSRRTVLSLLGAGALTLAMGGSAWAQAYPTRPLKLVVPFAPGGATDIAARALAKMMGDRLGTNVTVENKPGAGAIIGIDFVAKSDPDGYTLLYGSDSLILSQLTRKKVPFAVKDFIPLARVRYSSTYIAANAKVPFNNFKEMVAYAKANPGKLTYASGGAGTIVHLAFEMMKLKTGIHIVHIPYRGSGPSVIDTVGGQVDLVVGGIAEMMPFIRSGQLKAIGMTGLKPVATAPMMPAIAEMGYPGFAVTNWNGVLAPAGTPPEIVKRLTDVIAEVAESAELQKALEATGAEPNALLKGEAFGTFIGKTMGDFRTLIDTVKLTFED